MDGRRAAAAQHQIAREQLALQERDIALKERAQQKPERPKRMPEDLQRRIFAWEDTFAQEDEARTLNELYQEYQDWDKVRQKVLPMSVRAQSEPSDRSMVQE